MNAERTQFFDQDAPTDDFLALAEATREERLVAPTPAKDVESNDEEYEATPIQPNKLKKIIGRTAVVLVAGAASITFGNLLINAVDHQITHNQQVNDEYVNQSHEVNSDTVIQIPAPTK